MVTVSGYCTGILLVTGGELLLSRFDDNLQLPVGRTVLLPKSALNPRIKMLTRAPFVRGVMNGSQTALVTKAWWVQLIQVGLTCECTL
jgi:hypothetical protein